jgi:hypothetical protein
MTNLLVVFFLFTWIVSNSLSTLTAYHDAHAFVVSKKAKTGTKSDTELPYEEKESEKEVENRTENKSQHHVLFVSLNHDAIQLAATLSSKYWAHNAPRFCGNAAGIPLYLAKRTLLI